MNLYNLTLSKAGAITQAVTLAGAKSSEFVLSRGKYLELWNQDEHTGKLTNLISSELFGLARCIAPFRMTNQGASKDYVVIGSDSGRLTIIEVDHEKKQFLKIHQETFGKTGCRRIVPGQYVAVEPKGRAIMIGAVEKQKFVYVLNRDQNNRLTISSPLEAHSPNTILYSMVALDNGFDNPLFACLEVDYSEGPEKNLCVYELDLGLNSVIKKSTKVVSASAHMLIPVPGSDKGPGGVLVCSDNMITHVLSSGKEVSVAVPRRFRKDGDYSRGNMIVAQSIIEKKNLFFYLLQTEEGDLMKLDVAYKGKNIESMTVGYLDSIPVAVSICVLMVRGCVFVASEFGNHALYLFKSLDKFGKIVDDVEISKVKIPLYHARGLTNLSLREESESLSPIIDFKAMDLTNEGTPQLYTICGRANRSSFRVLKHGLPVNEMAVTTFQGTPLRIWTVKKNEKEQYDNLMLVSFSNHTACLSIGDSVEQVNDAGFMSNVASLAVGTIKNSLVQIHPNGIRQILSDKKTEDLDVNRQIKSSCLNEAQIAIATNGGEIRYFEANQKGIMVHLKSQEMNQEVACLGIASVPKGSRISRYLAVGFYDKTVRILSLDPNEVFQQLGRIVVPADPESIAITEMESRQENGDVEQVVYMFVGLNNGLLMRYTMDPHTGDLSDPRSRLLGSKPVKVVVIKSQGQKSVMANSSRSWLCYNYQGKFTMTPLSYDPLTSVASMCSKSLPDGLVAVTGQTLRVFSIEKYGEIFNQSIVPLKYTPRKFVIHPETKKVFIIETDHNAYSMEELDKIDQESMDTEEKGETYCKRPSNSGKWASYIHAMDPITLKTIEYIPMDEDEAAYSLAIVSFNKEFYLCVGTGKDVRVYPRKNSGGFLNLYKWTDGKLELIHKTEVEDIPTAMIPFQGKLLVGIGKILRIYDLGQKKLLKKSENKNFPNIITTLNSEGMRIYVGDVMESFLFVKYKPEEGSLSIFADNTTPRWISCAGPIDYHTIAGGDKFGNIFVSRVPTDVNDTLDEDPTSNRWMWDRGVLGGAPQKGKEIVSFHVGETVTSIAKVNFVPGSAGVLMYMTIMGTIGCLIPFSLKEDVDFFSLLEMNLRQEANSLIGRDHLSFVSYYHPVKGVIDGDLLETYEKLPSDRQKAIADEIEKLPNDIKKKLQDVRNQMGY